MNTKVASFFIGLVSIFGVAIVAQPAFAVDDSRDCDQYAVIKCGTKSVAEIQKEYDTLGASGANGNTEKQADIARVFSAMGIDRNQINNENMKTGIVYRDGRVVVEGKVVATGAMMAARGLGGSQIANTSAQKVSVSAMSDAQTAFVKFDSNGKFLFAVMKPCGNPVTATPPKPEPKPSAECVSLTKEAIADRRYRFNATAETKDGATIESYRFVTERNGQKVDDKTVPSTAKKAGYTYSATTDGTYDVKVIVKTSLGNKDGQQCTQSFTVKSKPGTPGVTIEKLVDGVKEKQVALNSNFTYTLKVTNTGDTVLKNTVVTDTPNANIQLISATVGKIDGNTWTYTIPELKKGQSMIFSIIAKVPNQTGTKLPNTACVDTPSTPESPDACDEANVDVPTPDAPTPTELPETGPMQIFGQVLGLGSLASAGSYYFASRRK